MPEPSSPERRINRRTFFKRGAAVAATAVAAPIIGRGALGSTEEVGVPTLAPTTKDLLIPTPPDTEHQRLQQAGLGELINIYDQTKSILNTYHTLVNQPNLLSFYNACRQAIEEPNDKDNPNIVKVRDGWGEKQSETNEAARAHINTLLINTTATEEDPEEIRDFLRKYSDSLPLHILALPPVVEINKRGGIHNKAVILTSPKNMEDALFVLFHESNHALDFLWEPIKPYMSREQYIRYVESYLEHLSSLTNSFFSIPANELFAPGANQSSMFSRVRDASYGNLSDDQFMQQIEEYEESYPEYSLPEALKTTHNPTLRYTGLAHYIGRKLRHMSNSNEKDENFINNPLTKKIMNETFINIAHHLVNPPLKQNRLIIAGSLDDLPEDDLLFTGHHLAFSEERLNIFSTLNTSPTLAEFKRRLGLQAPLPNEFLEQQAQKIEWTKDQLLKKGAELLEEYEYENGKKYRMYQLPDNPFSPDRKLLFFQSTSVDFTDGMNSFLISIPAGNYDKGFANSQMSLTPTGDKTKVFSVATDANHTLEINLERPQENSYFHYEAVDPTVQLMEINNSYPTDFMFDHIAECDFVYEGNIEDKKVTSSRVIWTGASEDTRYYPIPESATNHDNNALILAGAPNQTAMLVRDAESNQALTLLEGTVFKGLGYVNSEELVLDEHGRYTLDGHQFAISEQKNEEIQKKLKEKRAYPAIKQRVITTDNDQSVIRFYLVIQYEDGNGEKKLYTTKLTAIPPTA